MVSGTGLRGGSGCASDYKKNAAVCAFCLVQGDTVAATVCHHVDGHPSDETTALYWSGPFQTLCLRCHNWAKQKQAWRGSLQSSDATVMSSQLSLERLVGAETLQWILDKRGKHNQIVALCGRITIDG